MDDGCQNTVSTICCGEVHSKKKRFLEYPLGVLQIVTVGEPLKVLKITR